MIAKETKKDENITLLVVAIFIELLSGLSSESAWRLRRPNKEMPTGSVIFCDSHASVSIRA